MEAVFAKSLSEKPFSRERCFATTLGIPPDVKQSAEGWWCALGWPREHLLRTSSSCELAWAKIWTDNTLARSLRAVRIATIIPLILIGLRSIGVIRDANINQPLALVLHARFPHTSAFIADCGSVEEPLPPSSHFPS